MTQKNQLADPVTASDHALGPKGAAVTIVEYGDFECPKCKQAVGAVKLLLARHEEQIHFVFRHFPIEEIHPHALQAAEFAECAGGQDRFWRMHDLLFENQRHLELVRLYAYATTLGLDAGRVAAEIERGVHRPRVRAHQRGGERSGVRATPTFYVNGRVHDVSYGLQTLFDVVADQLRATSSIG
jgi:protein-disulfide isomerase